MFSHGTKVKAGVFAITTTALVVLVGVMVFGQAQTGRAVQTVAGVKFDTLPGFVIERLNPPDRTDSYVALTFDSEGRPVVSKEQDYPRILLDEDGDGVYEAEQVWSDRVRNCQGLWFDARELYAACREAPTPEEIAAQQAAAAAQGGRGGGGRGGGPSGIFRMADTDGNDSADTFEMLTETRGGIQEHGPHAIRRAPDGSFSVIAGNHASIVDADLDLERTPLLRDGDMQLLEYLPNFGRSVRQAVHSAVYLWDRTVDKFTILFGGNRNAYDYAYNLHGEAFLYDSDMEWDINLPWYREVRTVHGIPGGNYGYRDGSGKLPPWYIDSLPPVRDLDRGSPVGVETYASYAYPSEFFDALFEADWSRGRLLYTDLRPNGATYAARPDKLEFIHGEPFNITDLEVGPDGLIYFTTGGRNTVGGFWRVRYTGAVEPAPDMTGIWSVVRQPQPLSSWGWAAIEEVKSGMGEAAFGAALEQLARDRGALGMERARALYEMQRHGPAPSAELLQALVSDQDVDVRTAVVFVAGVQGGLARAGQASVVESAAEVAAAGLTDGDPLVRRRAAEALVRMGQDPDQPSLAPVDDIYALINDNDRFVRWAGRLLLEQTAPAEWTGRVLSETNPLGAIEGMIAYVRVMCPAEPLPVTVDEDPGDDIAGANIDPTCPESVLRPVLDRQFTWLDGGLLGTEDKIRLARAIAYTAHHVEGGLPSADRERLDALVANQFPSSDERLNREFALLLAYAGQPGAASEILAAIPYGNTNEPLTIHYLYALRGLDEGWTTADKARLAEVLGHLSDWRGGAQFFNFALQLFDQLSDVYETDAEREMLYAAAPKFAPLTEEEIEAVAAARGRGRGGRGGRGTPNPLAVRTEGGARSRQETLEENIYQPQQNLDPAAGRQVFEASCAACHQYGAVGNDHGVAALNLTASPLRASKYSMLEAVVFPNRSVPPELSVNVIETTAGEVVEGIVLQEGAILPVLTGSGELRSLSLVEVASRRREPRSIMTEAEADALSQNERRNLLAFLNDEAPPAE